MRPSYWEWRAELEAQCARWRTVALGLGAGCLALVAMLAWALTRPTPVYFMAASGTAAVTGLARADRIPPEAVEAFAAQLALLLGNLTPATARESYTRARAFLTPGLQEQLALQISADLRAIEQQQLGTSLAVKDSRVLGASGGRWTVRVTGQRVSWAGPQRLGAEPVAYDFDVVRGRATADNPAGLLADRVSIGRPAEGGQEAER
jgi:hypothetical protein